MSRWTPEDLANYEARLTARAIAKPIGDLTRSLKRFNTVLTKATRDYKAELLQQLSLVGIQVEPEFQMLASRKFKADWRVIGTNVLIEFEGGLFAKGKQGHSSVAGILRDIEKYNLCAIAGWKVIRVTPKHVVSGEALRWIESALETSN